MATQINLQRNSEVFYSTVDLNGGAAATAMSSANTWKVEVLAGFAFSQASATQDITTLESGTSPDRSTQRFNTAVNPVEWNFQAYLRPTGIQSVTRGTAAGSFTGNSKPVSDWFLWQALVSNQSPASGATNEKSVWEEGGVLRTITHGRTANAHASKSNFPTATENHIYIKTDNVFYQIKNATVNEAAVDAAIDGIAATTWTGNGTSLIELTSDVSAPAAHARDRAVLVFGGILANGTSVSGNGVANVTVAAHGAINSSAPNHGKITFAKWDKHIVNTTETTASFIKNRLSGIDLQYVANTFSFPVTAMSFNYNNGITYLTPEELASLNTPIGQFTGSKTITGSVSAYLRAGSTTDKNASARFLSGLLKDTRTSVASVSSANLIVGGNTAPYVAFDMPAVQFNFPTNTIEDVIGITAEFLAQETTGNKGQGDELTIKVQK